MILLIQSCYLQYNHFCVFLSTIKVDFIFIILAPNFIDTCEGTNVSSSVPMQIAAELTVRIPPFSIMSKIRFTSSSHKYLATF
ncbi:hypothetical protein X975_00107, partial [Stegodyphus mimosarum]